MKPLPDVTGLHAVSATGASESARAGSAGQAGSSSQTGSGALSSPLESLLLTGNAAGMVAALREVQAAGPSSPLYPRYIYKYVELHCPKEAAALLKKLGKCPSVLEGVPFMRVCVQAQDVASARLGMKKGADVNAAGSDGLTALHAVCKSGDIKMVTFLCKSGASVNVRDSKGWPLIYTCSEAGAECDKALKVLLKHGPDYTLKADGSTCVHLAINRGDVKLLKTLASCRRAFDAAKDIANSAGATPLHVAVATNQTAVLKAFLKYSPNLGVLNTDGYTPYQIACREGNLDAIKLLLKAKVDATASSVVTVPAGEAGLGTLLSTSARATLQRLDTDVSARGGASGSLMQASTINGEPHGGPQEDSIPEPTLLREQPELKRRVTAPLLCMEYYQTSQNMRPLQQVLKSKPDLSVVLDGGETVLHQAVRLRDLPLLKLLLKAGAPLGQADSTGMTALLLAAGVCSTQNDQRFFQTIAKASDDILAVNGRRQGVLHCAFMAPAPRQEFAAFLLKKMGLAPQLHNTDEDGVPAIAYACRNPLAYVQSIAKGAAGLEKLRRCGAACLFQAFKYGQGDVARFLLQKGMDPNGTARGDRPLLYALIEDGCPAAACSLLQAKGISPAFTLADGTTCMHAAAAQNLPDVVTALASAGLPADARDKAGRSPLHVCAEKNSAQAARVLLGCGCDKTARDASGRTPAEVAAANGFMETQALLR